MVGGVVATPADVAQKGLDAAQTIAASLKNQELVAKIKGFQGHPYFWRGDFRSARPLYKSAELEAAHSTDLFSLPHGKGVVVLFGLGTIFRILLLGIARFKLKYGLSR